MVTAYKAVHDVLIELVEANRRLFIRLPPIKPTLRTRHATLQRRPQPCI